MVSLKHAVIFVGSLAVIMTAACSGSVPQSDQNISSPEAHEKGGVVPIDDSQTLPMPMPSISGPPATPSGVNRPSGPPGSEAGSQGEGLPRN